MKSLPILSIVFLSGCAAQPAELPILPAVVEVTAQDYAFVAPDTVAAGDITFRYQNRGPDFHHLVIVPLPEGKRGADLVADTAFVPTWTTMLGGPSVVSRGTISDTKVHLRPGRYAMICLIPTAKEHRQHKSLGMVKEFVVVPARLDREMVVAPTMSVILRDYDFEFSIPLTAGRVVLEVENRGNQPHEFEIARIDDGVSTQDAFKWRRTDSVPAPFHLLGGMSPLSPGERGIAILDLTPGHYAVVCYIPDAADGKPHVAHGMLQEFTIE